MIVIDTNVVVGMVVGGPNAVDAVALFERDADWAAPPIVMSELRNVLVGSLRRGTITIEDATISCDYAAAILGDRITSVDSSQVLDVAMECGLTAYDAEFVALARTLGVPLATLAGGILEGAPDVAARPAALLDTA